MRVSTEPADIELDGCQRGRFARVWQEPRKPKRPIAVTPILIRHLLHGSPKGFRMQILLSHAGRFLKATSLRPEVWTSSIRRMESSLVGHTHTN